MRDNLRSYRAIRGALTPGYPDEPQGNAARPVTTLAALISGMVGRQSTPLPTIAPHVPDGPKPESRVKRCARGIDNAHVTAAHDFFPSAEVLRGHLALPPRVRVLDGRVVGRGGGALRRHVVYKGRALPVAWLVRPGKQGHCPEDLHSALIAQVNKRIPPGAQGVVLGEGACDGRRLQPTMPDAGWSSGCRTGSNVPASWNGQPLRLETLGACITPGTVGA